MCILVYILYCIGEYCTMQAARRQKLLIMQLVEQVGLFSICSGRLGETLMMHCADPNTLPAPSRLCQLGQSLSLFLSPSVSFINPYPSFHSSLWLFKKRILNFYPERPAFALLSPALQGTSSHVTGSHSQKSSLSSFLVSFFLRIPCECNQVGEKCLLSKQYATELAGNQKQKMLTHVVQKCWRHKGWWNHSPLADREENCAENVSQIK